MTIICLDKGHKGKLLGQDCGCVGNGLYESDLTENIGNAISIHLKNNYDVDVRIAPRGTLTDRTNFANSINADYFLSVHINSATSKATGFESFVHNNASQKSLDIQNILHTEIMEYMKKYNVFDRGKKRANFAVLRNSKCNACLIECLFISNENDAKLLKDSNFLNGLSNNITYGLVKALNLQLKVTEKIKNEEINEDMALLDWQKKLGINAIDILSKKGIINDPETWKEDKNLESPIPGWLFFEVIKRVVEDK